MNKTDRFFLRQLTGLNQRETGTAEVSDIADVSGAKDLSNTKDISLTEIDLESFFSLAELQGLLPYCVEQTSRSSFSKADIKKAFPEYRDMAIRSAVRQITQQNQFLTLLLKLQEKGLDPVVIKGVILRELYPKPYYRLSVDDDLLILPEELPDYHREFVADGLEDDDDLYARALEEDSKVSEVSYHKPGSPLYIELHTSLFPSDSAAYGDCSRFFEKAMNRTVSMQVEDVTVRTLHPTDHFLYLILHSYKHFLHSGFGIRHIADLVLFAEAYGQKNDQLDWEYLYQCCESQHVVKFTAALFKTGVLYLNLDPVKAGIPEKWRTIIENTDADHLTEDILQSGMYGGSTLNRAHSSNITLDAVSEDKAAREKEARKKTVSEQDKEGGHSSSKRREKKHTRAVLKALLPSSDSLEGRYGYLKQHPYLLPAAWISRIMHYAFEHIRHKGISARESIEIGRERIELLKEYQIID